MRENCTYGSEGGEGGSPSRPLSGIRLTLGLLVTGISDKAVSGKDFTDFPFVLSLSKDERKIALRG